MKDTIIITHPEIIEFVQSNPSLNFTNFVLQIIRLVKENHTSSKENIVSDFRNLLQNHEAYWSLSFEKMQNDILQHSLNTINKMENSIRNWNQDNIVYNEIKDLKGHLHMTQLQSVQEQQGYMNIRQDLKELANQLSQLYDYTFNRSHIKKAKDAEKDIYVKLQDLLPTSEVILLSSFNQRARGDIQIIAQDKPTILVEVKNHIKQVPLRDIEKFQNDVVKAKCHGIMIATQGTIYGKQHLFIEILQNQYIAMYITQLLDDIEPVRIAIQLIYQLDEQLNKKDTACTINAQELELLSIEIAQHQDCVIKLKENMNSSLSILNKMTLGTFKQILVGNSLSPKKLKSCSS